VNANLQYVLRAWDLENETTRELLAQIPENHNDITAADGKGWRLGELVWHICISERWFCTDLLGLAPAGANHVPTYEPPATIAGMSDALLRSHAALAASLQTMDDAWLETQVTFHGRSWRRLDLLHLMLRHEVHHRGQLSILMLRAGAEPPTIYGAEGLTMEQARSH
jgi:uncharacterized damage-inducible protein DinB